MSNRLYWSDLPTSPKNQKPKENIDDFEIYSTHGHLALMNSKNVFDPEDDPIEYSQREMYEKYVKNFVQVRARYW